jgi:lysophospholipase L1-like esterase
MRWKSVAVLIVLTTALVAGLAPASGAAPPPFPDSMAAIGDSITRATDVCCFYGDHPRKSWSTGSASDSIVSHYERILANNPGMAGHGHNDAKSGAKMADAAGQASAAVGQQAEYVTILLGANDACARSAERMTPVQDFRNQFQAAMDTLQAGLPASAHIFVSSIPNIYRLWQVLHTNPLAQAVWWGAKICQSMLSPFNSREDRLRVLARVQAYNGVLDQVCGLYANCRFDGYAVFNYQFTAGHVSKLDYFHPNVSGQATLASITWATSWWPGS